MNYKEQEFYTGIAGVESRAKCPQSTNFYHVFAFNSRIYVHSTLINDPLSLVIFKCNKQFFQAPIA